jgi:hypothetical protein
MATSTPTTPDTSQAVPEAPPNLCIPTIAAWLADANKAYDEADDLAEASSHDVGQYFAHIRKRDKIGDRADALRALISTLPAASVFDVGVQSAVLTNAMKCDPGPSCRSCADDHHTMVDRLIGSITAALQTPEPTHSELYDDAEVRRLAEAFEEAHDAYVAAMEATGDVDSSFEPHHLRQAAGFALAEAKPRTLAGHAARARAALKGSKSFVPDDEDGLRYLPDGLLLGILQDLADLPAAAI